MEKLFVHFAPGFPMPVTLIILPRFHGYEDYIVKEMESLGHNVYPILEKPAILLGLWRHILPLCFIQAWIRYYILRQIKLQNGRGDVDNFLLIRGEYITPELVEEIKMIIRPAYTHMHQWDTINTTISALALAPYFDRCTTYSRQDAEMYSTFTYKPNFFLPVFEQTVGDTPKYYKFCFIGVLYGKRLQIIKRLDQIISLKGWSFYRHIFVTHFGFIKQKFRHGNRVCREDFRYHKLNAEQCASIYHHSSIVLDICDTNKKGITTRFYEALAAGCKVVTNNENVIDEAIYSPNLVYVVSDDFAINLDDHFFSEPIQKAPDLRPYTLNNWVKGFFDEG